MRGVGTFIPVDHTQLPQRKRRKPEPDAAPSQDPETAAREAVLAADLREVALAKHLGVPLDKWPAVRKGLLDSELAELLSLIEDRVALLKAARRIDQAYNARYQAEQAAKHAGSPDESEETDSREPSATLPQMEESKAVTTEPAPEIPVSSGGPGAFDKNDPFGADAAPGDVIIPAGTILEGETEGREPTGPPVGDGEQPKVELGEAIGIKEFSAPVTSITVPEPESDQATSATSSAQPADTKPVEAKSAESKSTAAKKTSKNKQPR